MSHQTSRVYMDKVGKRTQDAGRQALPGLGVTRLAIILYLLIFLERRFSLGSGPIFLPIS